MKLPLVALPSLLMGTGALAEPATPYRYDTNTRASDFAREFFGSNGNQTRAPRLDMGNVGVNVGTELDCGKLDVRANIRGEFNKIQEQVKALIPKNASDVTDLVSRTAMISVCYAYPTVCAQIRHDFVSLQANLNLRAQACQAMDKFIDSQADKGAKQLRAEAQAECVSSQVRSGVDPSTATGNCQSRSGLPIRDFQAGLEKKFTTRKQKVLSAIVKFAHVSEPTMYAFLTSFLGEIEVQADGYWQPLFTSGMLRPYDVAAEFLAEGQERACGNLGAVLARGTPQGSTVMARSVSEVVRKRISQEDISNLDDLGTEDRKLACAALGRAIGQVAAEKSAAEGEAIVASGLLNTAIPNSLRDEYRSRSNAAFVALRKTLESDQIPPLETVRTAVAQLARATREKNRLIASGISSGKVENSRQESQVKSDCVDTLSCGGGQ